MRDYSKIAPQDDEVYYAYNGQYSMDPIIQYKGHNFQNEDVRDALWENFLGEANVDIDRYNEDEDYWREVEDAFDEYQEKNIRNLLDDWISLGVK